MPKTLRFPADLPRRIKVRISHLSEGRYKDPYQYPLALALRERLVKLLGYEPAVRVDDDRSWVQLEDGRNFIAYHSQRVEWFVWEWDGVLTNAAIGSYISIGLE